MVCCCCCGRSVRASSDRYPPPTMKAWNRERVKSAISISDPSRRMRYLVLRIDWSTVYFLPQANIRSNPANQSVALRIYAEGSEDKWCTSTTPINAEHQKIGTRYNPRAQPYSPVPCDHSALTFDIGHCVIMGESMSEVNAPSSPHHVCTTSSGRHRCVQSRPRPPPSLQDALV